MTASTALSIANEVGYSPAKLQLIKDTIARGASDDELALFLYTAQRTGLDPLTRQIYCIKRWDSTLQREAMTTQTSIDGLRLVADRTGRYAPGRATTYEYDKDGHLLSATAYILKYVQGTWHEVSATAYYDEYVQTKNNGTPTAMWKSKPRIMLGKCAEALCLRRGFPAELSGVYASEEMGDEEQRPAPAAPVIVEPVAKSAPRLTPDEIKTKWTEQNDRADALGIEVWTHDLPTGQKLPLSWYIDEIERRAALIAQAETVIDAA